MRHAKAEPFAATDHVRRLTDKGRADAADAAAHLASSHVVPDYALVSPSARTVSTWRILAEAMGANPDVSLDDAVYTGSADVVVDALRSVPEDAGTVVFVGHNPTAAHVCHLLDDGDGEADAVSGLLRGFPPAAVVVLEIGVPWAEIGPESGRVLDFYIGQG